MKENRLQRMKEVDSDQEDSLGQKTNPFSSGCRKGGKNA